MVGLPDGEKNFEDMCNRLGTIPACDRQTARLIQADNRPNLQRISSCYTPKVLQRTICNNNDVRPTSQTLNHDVFNVSAILIHDRHNRQATSPFADALINEAL